MESQENNPQALAAPTRATMYASSIATNHHNSLHNCTDSHHRSQHYTHSGPRQFYLPTSTKGPEVQTLRQTLASEVGTFSPPTQSEILVVSAIPC